jgi:hypothetical protein
VTARSGKWDIRHLRASENHYLTLSVPASAGVSLRPAGSPTVQSALNHSEEAWYEMANSRSGKPASGRADRL